MAFENVTKPRVILFTSCKGGVGKSTVCANLAMTLAMRRKRVLMIDCDFGSRCLDLVFGFSDIALYYIGDVVLGRISPEKAIVRDNRSDCLFFIGRPYSFDNGISVFAFKRAIASYVQSGRFDYIFIDTPGGAGEPLIYAAAVADTAYIITSPSRASVRAADKTAAFLCARGVTHLRLIINMVTGRRIKPAKEALISIVDGAAVRLIGAVPYDPELVSAGDEGILTDELFSLPVTRAFDNIAARTEGEQVPLFHKINKLRQLR